MKVNVQQIETGVANYLDHELMAKLERSSWQKLVVGTAISLGIKRYSSLAQAYLQTPMFKEVGVVDGDGLVDIGLLRDVLKENMDDDGVKLPELPVVGILSFKKADIDSLYDHITTINK